MFNKSIGIDSLKKFLIISTTGMGDTLWSTPAIRAIKKTMPNSCIDLLLQPQWKSLFSENKNIRGLYSYYPKWYRQLLTLPSILKSHYDHVFIFHANKDISRLLPWVRCSNIWLNQDLNPPGRFKWRTKLFMDYMGTRKKTQMVPFSKPTHPIHRRLDMLKETHIIPDGTHMEIFINDDENKKSNEFLKYNQITKNNFIYLNIGGSLPQKQWPQKKFIALSKRIISNTSLFLVLGGGPDDAHRINTINEEINHERVVLAKDRSLIENCALIKNAKILVTPDSGPMHIGFALKVPTISLWPVVTSNGEALNPMNGPDYCGPLDIDQSLCCVLRGNFLDINHKSEVEQLFIKQISVDDVWQKILKFL